MRYQQSLSVSGRRILLASQFCGSDCPELPLVRSRAFGVLWLREFDPYIEVIPTNITAFLSIMLSNKHAWSTNNSSCNSVSNSVTHGKDTEFVSDLAELRNCMDELKTSFTDTIIYIRGDGNVNSNNDSRVVLLQQLILDYNLARMETGHHTYHHFVGNGMLCRYPPAFKG